MALLHMCITHSVSVHVAHVNYHHREEADEEEQYVRQFCTEHDIPCSVRNEPFESKGNFEADARQWRYSFFEELVKQYHLSGVLVAHHNDDLIETFIMQEEKNIVPAWYGLKEEMQYHGMTVKRPLLGYTKAQLIGYCESHGIRYYTDVTNLSDDYTRNRIRHSIVEKLSDSERKLYLKEIEMRNAEKQERECRTGAIAKQKKVSLNLYRKMSEEDRLSLLRKLIEKDSPDHRMSLEYFREMDNVIVSHNDFVIELKEGRLVQEDGMFFVADTPEPYAHVYACREEMQNVCEKYYITSDGSPGVHAVTLYDDDFPVTIRSVLDGDTITMRFGNKNVHRFFVDRHIPRWRRSTWPIIENAHGKVIFVAGLGCDVDHYTVKPDLNVLSLYHYTK